MLDEIFDLDEISYPALALAILGAFGVGYYLLAIAKASIFQGVAVALLQLVIGYFIAARMLDG